MKILVVNDDSIHAPGLALLAEKAMALGEVWVVAPAHQCSAMSQRLSIHAALRVEKVDFPVPVRGAYQVDGTPVDCVKTALQYILPERPDFVFSGINAGYNVGFDIAYSGTLGAAFEAVMNGIRAIAFSSTMGKPLDVAREYLEPLKATGIDTLILGCTHYPLLTDVIADVMGPGVTLVSAGEESAFELKRLLKADGLRAEETRQGEAEFYVSDQPEDFERIASVFLQEDIRHVARRIDIDRY